MIERSPHVFLFKLVIAFILYRVTYCIYSISTEVSQPLFDHAGWVRLDL